MSTILIIVHVIVCVALIMIVLLQTGKGADMGAAFGGRRQSNAVRQHRGLNLFK
jgi:protein translocase SecG subunit